MSRLMKKVNSDETCDNYNNIDTFRASLPWNEERVTYITSRWSVTRNCARTLILKEIGKSVREIADLLYLTRSTIKKYINELADKISIEVVMHISHKRAIGKKFDVWGEGETDPIDVTQSSNQFGPRFNERETPLNRGVELEEIDDYLITIEH